MCQIHSGVFRGQTAMPPRVAHPNFLQINSTGTVHGRLVRGLLLQAHLLQSSVPECVRIRNFHSENWKISPRLLDPGAFGARPLPLTKIPNTPLPIHSRPDRNVRSSFYNAKQFLLSNLSMFEKFQERRNVSLCKLDSLRWFSQGRSRTPHL